MKSSPEDLKAPHEQLTPEVLSNVIFWSFYYSQGSEGLQKDLFMYIASKYPDWKHTIGSISREKTYEKVSTFLFANGPHTRTSGDRIANKKQVDAMVTILGNCFNEEINLSHVVFDIITRIINRDYYFLSKNSRPGNSSRKAGIFGRAESHYLMYVEGSMVPPGHQVYKNLFTDLKRTMAKEPESLEKSSVADTLSKVREMCAKLGTYTPLADKK